MVKNLWVLLSLLVSAGAFIYKLDDPFDEDSRFSYSEGWMYGTDRGPAGGRIGNSYVVADLEVTAIPLNKPSSFNISVLFYRSDISDFLDNNINICPAKPVVPAHYNDIKVLQFPAISKDSTEEGEDLRVAAVNARAEVEDGGLQGVFFQVCPAEVDVKVLVADGQLTFHNPYGYLPGMLFGCLPFEISRVGASVVMCLFFALAMWKNRPTVLSVHHMIFGVMLLATLEAMSWLGAYSYMNSTGQPYCCPNPWPLVLALCMEVLRRTTSRFLLLVICLGYGITRMELARKQKLAVAVLTVAFLASAILQLASMVASASTFGTPYAVDPLLLVPALLTDIIYLTWIYGSLANMLKELKETNQTFKRQMYSALAYTLASFVILFTLLTIIMLAAEGSQDNWQWKWEWIQVVSWEVLNFFMLAAVGIIWRPTERSAMLAYSKQLATNEESAEEEDGIEVVHTESPVPTHFTIGYEDDEEGPPHGQEYGSQDHDKERADRIGDSGESHAGPNYSFSAFEPQRHADLT